MDNLTLTFLSQKKKQKREGKGTKLFQILSNYQTQTLELFQVLKPDPGNDSEGQDQDEKKKPTLL